MPIRYLTDFSRAAHWTEPEWTGLSQPGHLYDLLSECPRNPDSSLLWQQAHHSVAAARDRILRSLATRFPGAPGLDAERIYHNLLTMLASAAPPEAGLPGVNPVWKAMLCNREQRPPDLSAPVALVGVDHLGAIADFQLWRTTVDGLYEHPGTALSPFGKSLLETVRDAWPGEPHCLWSLSPGARFAGGTSPGGVISTALACLEKGLAYRPDRLILTTLGFRKVECEEEKIEAARRERAIEQIAVAPDSGLAGHYPTVSSLPEAIRFATGSEEEDDPYYQPFPQENELKQLLAENRPVNLAVIAPQRGGKSLLCHRLLHYAAGLGRQTVFVELPPLGEAESSSSYYRGICGQIARQIEVDAPSAAEWDASPHIPSMRLEIFLERHLLPRDAHRRVVLYIDKVHRLVDSHLQEEFYNMLRSWSEIPKRPTLQGRRWQRLSLLISSAMDVDAYLNNPANASLFNTFTVFYLGPVAAPGDYLKRHRPGSSEVRIQGLVALSGAMAALIRLLAEHPEADFLSDSGAIERHFGPHLRQLRTWLERDPELDRSFREFVRDGKLPAARRHTALLYRFGLLSLTPTGDFTLAAGLYRSLVQNTPVENK